MKNNALRNELAAKIKFIRNNMNLIDDNKFFFGKRDLHRYFVPVTAGQEYDALTVTPLVIDLLISLKDKRNLRVEFESRTVPYEDYEDNYAVIAYDKLESDEEYYERINPIYEDVSKRADPEYKEFLRLYEKFM